MGHAKRRAMCTPKSAASKALRVRNSARASSRRTRLPPREGEEREQAHGVHAPDGELHPKGQVSRREEGLDRRRDEEHREGAPEDGEHLARAEEHGPRSRLEARPEEG